MSSKRIFTLLFALTIMTISSLPVTHSAGRSPNAAVNTILNGKGAPKSSLGINGDFYIDTRSLLIYGPKSKNKWPTPKSLQGPTGASGSNGKNGADGKVISNANVSSLPATKGDQGAQGVPGPLGERGEKGEKGEVGVAGPVGAPGGIGPAGAPGASGLNGASGPQGTTGPAGAAGAIGAKGETGTAGPSEVTVIDIPEFTLATSSEYSYITSVPVGNLQQGRSYYLNIFLIGRSDQFDLILGADLVSPGNVLKFDYIRSMSAYSTYSETLTTYRFHFTGTIQIGVSDSSLAIRIINGREEHRSIALSLTGRAYITLVGAIK